MGWVKIRCNYWVNIACNFTALDNGIPYMDIGALFSANGSADRFISFDNAHFDTAGYRILAEAYAAMLWPLLKEKVAVRLSDGACR